MEGVREIGGVEVVGEEEGALIEDGVSEDGDEEDWIILFIPLGLREV